MTFLNSRYKNQFPYSQFSFTLSSQFRFRDFLKPTLTHLSHTKMGKMDNRLHEQSGTGSKHRHYHKMNQMSQFRELKTKYSATTRSDHRHQSKLHVGAVTQIRNLPLITLTAQGFHPIINLISLNSIISIALLN